MSRYRLLMQANSAPMDDTFGKQQQTIVELQAELATLKGEVLPFHSNHSITTVQPTVKVKSGCPVKARSGAADTMRSSLHAIISALAAMHMCDCAETHPDILALIRLCYEGLAHCSAEILQNQT